jgi:glucosamine-6-phosphate deaminase
MAAVSSRDLYKWCAVHADALEMHPDRKMPFRMVRDSREMGLVMVRDLLAEIEEANEAGRPVRAIIPCGPNCWYEPFVEAVNRLRVSLKNLTVFHMDECLDWQGRLLAENHPYNFRTFMLRHFYGGIPPELAVPESQRFFLRVERIDEIEARIAESPIDITMGGWGQDGHIAYNQARRHPYSAVGVEEFKSSSIRMQENNWDTMLALAQRTFGGAYQFVPPMSITLGIRQCLSARKVRLYSDTGAWKQTALRVALFSAVTEEYPITLLQEHTDALITATEETARHPISEHPEWRLEDLAL